MLPFNISGEAAFIYIDFLLNPPEKLQNKIAKPLVDQSLTFLSNVEVKKKMTVLRLCEVEMMEAWQTEEGHTHISHCLWPRDGDGSVFLLNA